VFSRFFFKKNLFFRAFTTSNRPFFLFTGHVRSFVGVLGAFEPQDKPPPALQGLGALAILHRSSGPCFGKHTSITFATRWESLQELQLIWDFCLARYDLVSVGMAPVGGVSLPSNSVHFSSSDISSGSNTLQISWASASRVCGFW
jgi:hypothetical protein